MRVPLDVMPAGPTYVHLKTVFRHFGAKTKNSWAIAYLANQRLLDVLGAKLLATGFKWSKFSLLLPALVANILAVFGEDF